MLKPNDGAKSGDKVEKGILEGKLEKGILTTGKRKREIAVCGVTGSPT